MHMWHQSSIKWSPRPFMQEERWQQKARWNHIPWSGDRPMLWDFTCPRALDMSQSIGHFSASDAAASEAEVCKSTNFIHSHIFLPVAIKTLGVWGPGAIELVNALGHRLLQATRDPRSQFFWRRRIDIPVQRGNALSVRGTFSAASAAGVWGPGGYFFWDPWGVGTGGH